MLPSLHVCSEEQGRGGRNLPLRRAPVCPPLPLCAPVVPTWSWLLFAANQRLWDVFSLRVTERLSLCPDRPPGESHPVLLVLQRSPSGSRSLQLQQGTVGVPFRSLVSSSYLIEVNGPRESEELAKGLAVCGVGFISPQLLRAPACSPRGALLGGWPLRPQPWMQILPRAEETRCKVTALAGQARR